MAIQELSNDEINVVAGGLALLGLDLGGLLNSLLTPIVGIVANILTLVAHVIDGVGAVVSRLIVSVGNVVGGLLGTLPASSSTGTSS